MEEERSKKNWWQWGGGKGWRFGKWGERGDGEQEKEEVVGEGRLDGFEIDALEGTLGGTLDTPQSVVLDTRNYPVPTVGEVPLVDGDREVYRDVNHDRNEDSVGGNIPPWQQAWGAVERLVGGMDSVRKELLTNVSKSSC